jgi:hypothetical protein
MKGSLVWLPLHHLWLHFHATSMMMPRPPPIVAPSLVLRQNWETLAWLASWWSKPLDVYACPHTVLIRSSVLRHKPTNLLPLGFEAQTKSLSRWFWGTNHQTIDLSFEAWNKKLPWWFWGQTTDKLSLSVLRQNRKPHASRLLHVYDVNHTQHHLTSWSSGHWVPNLCLIILDPLHQVFYSCLDPHCCPPCRICHLHITRQASMFLQTK